MYPIDKKKIIRLFAFFLAISLIFVLTFNYKHYLFTTRFYTAKMGSRKTLNSAKAYAKKVEAYFSKVTILPPMEDEERYTVAVGVFFGEEEANHFIKKRGIRKAKVVSYPLQKIYLTWLPSRVGEISERYYLSYIFTALFILMFLKGLRKWKKRRWSKYVSEKTWLVLRQA